MKFQIFECQISSKFQRFNVLISKIHWLSNEVFWCFWTGRAVAMCQIFGICGVVLCERGEVFEKINFPTGVGDFGWLFWLTIGFFMLKLCLR